MNEWIKNYSKDVDIELDGGFTKKSLGVVILVIFFTLITGIVPW